MRWMILCLLLVGCSSNYTFFYDNCIERNPNDNVYCECISANSDGYAVITPTAYDECWEYKVKHLGTPNASKEK